MTWSEMGMRRWISALLDVVMPRTCGVCGCTLVEGEEVMCLGCLMRMPRTDLHRTPTASPVMKFTASCRIVRMASMFYYNKNGSYAEMLKRSKYMGHPEIDRKLGEMFARELMAEGFFDGIDMLVPVPMHRWKRLMRGFNQAEEIALGVSGVTGIPLARNLVATRGHATQTRKSAGARRMLAESVFAVKDAEALQGCHLLLIDDIITTGATVSACANVLRRARPDVKLSLFSLALTGYG